MFTKRSVLLEQSCRNLPLSFASATPNWQNTSSYILTSSPTCALKSGAFGPYICIKRNERFNNFSLKLQILPIGENPFISTACQLITYNYPSSHPEQDLLAQR